MSDYPSNALAGPLKVALVENHPDTLKYLRMYLESLGHSVEVASTMADGLALLARVPVDVLISDIGLIDGDGWQLMQLAQLPSTVYAIAMSGFGMGSDQSRSKAAGFRHHLLKPFTPSQLSGLLQEAQRERANRLETADHTVSVES